MYVDVGSFKRIFKIIALFLFINFLFAICPIKMGINFTKSVNCILYLYKNTNNLSTIKKRNLILFKINSKFHYGILDNVIQGKLFLKYAEGMPGDYLICSEFINKCALLDKKGNFIKYVGVNMPKDKNTSIWEFAGIIPDGFVAVFGDNERSYDTRIAGLVPEKQIKGKVILCLLKNK